MISTAVILSPECGKYRNTIKILLGAILFTERLCGRPWSQFNANTFLHN